MMGAGSVDDRRRQRRNRLTALLLGLLAVAFYVGFIGLTVWGG